MTRRLDEFAKFRIATKLHKEEGDVQRDSLLYAMGGGGGNKQTESQRSENRKPDVAAAVVEVVASRSGSRHATCRELRLSGDCRR